MDIQKPFEGLICPMLTPFDKHGHIDLNTTRKLVDHLIARGVNSLLPCGTTGEGMLLTLEERKKIAQTAVEQAAGRATVIVHTGCISTADTLTLTKHARDIGADAVSVITPYFYSYSDSELFDHYAAVANAVPDLPVSLYAFPGNAKHEISIYLFNQLRLTFPNILAIKLSSIDLIRFQEYIQLGGPNFNPLCGVDALFLPALSIGSCGQVSGNANVFPEVFRRLLDAYLQSDFETAKQQQILINEIRSLLKDHLAFFKAAMKLRGLPVGDPRPPIRSLSEQEIADLEQGINNLDL
jgi:4-hydroxy-tetrahydrodipicolinate synthase